MNIQRRTLLAGAAAIPLLASCARGPGEQAVQPPPTSKPAEGKSLKNLTPGTLLSQDRIDTGITGARAWRVHYVTEDVNDVVHESTGLVIAPSAKSKDRPILTWCHGTTGLGDAACPSAQPDPARELITYFSPESTQQIDFGVPGLQGFVDDGWVVAATDYQGLGSEGMHQYMVNRTQARDAVFLARAVRQLSENTGTKLGCVGWSQGGGAAAAVAELDAADFDDLKLVGTVAMSPGVAGIAVTSPGGPAAALAGSTVPPDSHLVMMFAGVQTANPSTLALTDVFSPLGVDIVKAAWNAQPVHHLNDVIARNFRLKGPVLAPRMTNFEAWKAAIVAGSAGTRKPVAPVLVCIDSFDGGTVIPVAWQTAYVDAVTRFGGSVEVRDYPRDDHFSLPQSCVADARSWLRSKL